MVTTPVGDSVMARRVSRSFPISFSNRVTWVDLVEIDIADFDVILGMDCLLEVGNSMLRSCFMSKRL